KNRTGARIGAGTLYPLRYELEDQKLVAGEWNSPNRRRRRIYKITEPGTKHKKQGFKSIGLLVQPSSAGPRSQPAYNLCRSCSSRRSGQPIHRGTVPISPRFVVALVGI